MTKIICHLERTQQYTFTAHERNVALSSALLHDVGHGPFSHCFEQITGIHHEQWSIRMIIEDPDIIRILDHESILSADVASVLERQGRFPVIETLLFSPVGADKLDYHNRDLFFSNLRMDVVNLELLISGFLLRDGKLVLLEDRLSEVEKFLQIRSELFAEVFGHPIVIGYDLLLKMVFARAKQLFKANALRYMPIELLALLDQSMMWTVHDYQQLDDEKILSTVQHWTEEEDHCLSDLASRFVGHMYPDLPFTWRKIEYDTCLSPLEECLNPCNAVLHTSDLHYGSYQGGICVSTSGGSVDVQHVSSKLRFAKRESENYFYYVHETPCIRNFLCNLDIS